MLRATALAAAGLLLATTTSAQLSGNYTIDPNGSGSRNFKRLMAAGLVLEKNGVKGPVTFTVAAGTFFEDWSIAPIAGTSKTNTVTFKVLKKHGTTITPVKTNGRSLELVFGTDTKPVEWLVFDGLVFSTSIYVYMNQSRFSRANRNLVFKDCKFDKGMILYGADSEVHHCTGTSLSLRGDGFSVHHNDVTSIGVTGDYYTGNARARIFNNRVVNGSIYMSGNNSYVTHNTIVSNLRNGTGFSLTAHYLRPVYLYGNIVVHAYAGTQSGYFTPVTFRSGGGGGYVADGNLFYATASTTQIRFLFDNKLSSSLSAWQTATGWDKKSLQTDPKFKNPSSGDYHLTDSSPAIDKAVGTPAFVLNDLDGIVRDAKPDMGCYEAFVPFSTFGAGCKGSLGNVPAIGSSGTAKLGSTNFAITLANALGGANLFFAVGVSDKSWGGIKLPISFGGSCKLQVSAEFLFQLKASGSGPGNGTASVKVTIPNDPKLKGLTFFGQWAVIDKGAAAGLAFSNAGKLILK